MAVLGLLVLATTLSPARCDCDSVFSPGEEESPPPPLPQHSQSCRGPFPVLLKVSLGEKFAGLEHVVRTEPSSLVVGRCSGQCRAGYHSVCRGTNTNTRSVLASPQLTFSHKSSSQIQPHLTSPHLTSPHSFLPRFTSVPLTSPRLNSSHLTSPHLNSSHITSPHLSSPHLTSPHLTSPHLTF